MEANSKSNSPGQVQNNHNKKRRIFPSHSLSPLTFRGNENEHTNTFTNPDEEQNNHTQQSKKRKELMVTVVPVPAKHACIQFAPANHPLTGQEDSLPGPSNSQLLLQVAANDSVSGPFTNPKHSFCHDSSSSAFHRPQHPFLKSANCSFKSQEDSPYLQLNSQPPINVSEVESSNHLFTSQEGFFDNSSSTLPTRSDPFLKTLIYPYSTLTYPDPTPTFTPSIPSEPHYSPLTPSPTSPKRSPTQPHSFHTTRPHPFLTNLKYPYSTLSYPFPTPTNSSAPSSPLPPSSFILSSPSSSSDHESFDCSACEEGFSSEAALWNHVREFH